ncbi:MAG: S-methyl-5-thioribose-1-phosphate isomerase [Thermoplasmatota archaeon]
MRFRIGEAEHDRPCFWIEDDRIFLIDQRSLPESIDIITVDDMETSLEMIRSLAVRGAPAIGAFGSWSLALAIRRGEDPLRSRSLILRTRPTAFDLEYGLDLVMEGYESGGREGAVDSARMFYDNTIETCRRIGEAGSHLIGPGSRVLTHCNAGALASLDWGTALSPIRHSFREGRDPFVWVSETRPLLQGARLTAWELRNEGIRHSVIVDSASAYLMARGDVDIVVVGADRICCNGDFANKIGTLQKAQSAHEFRIPFYVAAPLSTFDGGCRHGDDIPIEIRGGEEISMIGDSRFAPSGSECFNPAFDVTPAKYVTGFITPDGVISPEEIKKNEGAGAPSI